MPVNLLNPVLSKRTKSVNFFNGRLLAGEDLTTEQVTNRVAHSLLGKAIGDGVVYGLEVTISSQSNAVQSPVLAINPGLAINKNGGSLLLETNTEVALVRPASGTNGSTIAPIFQDCTPVQAGNYIAGAGVYLLTIGPATAPEGLAEVSGVSTTTAPCNTKYNVPGVQFRLISIDLQASELADVNHLRNLVAYKCFGFTSQFNSQASFAADPFNSPMTTYGLLDDLRTGQVLTNCEVPLAVLYWTADQGIVFVDMWAVRRPVFPQAATQMWAPLSSRRRMAEGLAMFLQFQEQINDMVEFGVGGTALTSIVTTDYFEYLPPVGILPISASKDGNTNSFASFFEGLTVRGPEFIEGARLQSLVHSSLAYPPIDLATGEFIWLYTVRENIQAFDNNLIKTPEAYMVFSNGHMPYQANARFDGERWDYSNYALR
jgi:hypothetical protein